jgi:peptidoglycan hydrolase-like protein with peptidoglycan-binding domain
MGPLAVTRLAVIVSVAALAAPAGAAAGVNPQIAGLQVALRAHGLYLAQIDGISGPKTVAAIHAFQRQHGLPVGLATTRTRLALGPLGRPLFGARTLDRGDFGFDVAVLQFLMTRAGVYTGALYGYLGAETARAVRRFQRALKVKADAVVGPRTVAAIVRRDGVPVKPVNRPVRTAIADTFHVVRVGDTLTAIAAADGTTIAAIASLNHLNAAKPIILGQRLRLPPKSVALAPARADVVGDLNSWSAKLGVDPHLVRALAWMESGFQTGLVSSAGARGVLQTLPSTRLYVESVLAGHAIPHTVNGDVHVGVLYLKHLLAVFNGNQNLALAGWYQGELAVRQHGVYAVSKPFVADVLSLVGKV